jgi:transposase
MGQAIAVSDGLYGWRGSAGLPSGRRMRRRRADCWRSRQCSRALRGKMPPRWVGWTVRHCGTGCCVSTSKDRTGLINIPSPGMPPKLGKKHRAFLARLVEEGPIPAVDGVVRWRACDLIMRLYEEFRLSVSDDTVYRALKDLGFSHVSARPKAYKQDADAMEAFKKNFANRVAEVRAKLAPGTPVEVWFQDEMRVGQKNKLTYRWARKGSRP